VLISVALPPGLLERLDEWWRVAGLETRTAAIRELLERGLK